MEINPAPHDPMSVARTLIKKAETHKHDITHLQLQKMLYLCHSLMLGCYGRPLLNTEFQAWQYGPVHPEIYDKFKGGGDLPIPPKLYADHEKYDDQEMEVIDAVFDHCKGKHGYTLVKMVCNHNGPWYKIRKRYKKDVNIPDQVLRDHFSQFYT